MSSPWNSCSDTRRKQYQGELLDSHAAIRTSYKAADLATMLAAKTAQILGKKTGYVLVIALNILYQCQPLTKD